MNEVTIKINNLSSSLSIGESDVLEASVYKGSVEIADTDIVWSTSDDSILDIIDGVVTAKSVGSATITASIKDTSISSSVDINVSDTPIVDEYELIINPNINYVLQNTSQQFSVYLYKNGIKQNDTVSFLDISSNIPAGKYTIIVDDDNSFTLYNNGMYMNNPVVVKCVSGTTIKEFNIMLRGLY